jgi:glycosyltransferase involved in cell wall biosynthesis
MESTPKISVILPAYNAATYLKEAIDSILSQTYVDFELLIINDGSKDSTESIILGYDDSRIKYYKHDYNLGLVKTLNEGIELSHGEFIARMDADDISLPKRFEKQVKLFEQKHDVMICGTMNQWFGARNDKLPFPKDTDGARVGLLFGCFVSHPSVMFRRDFLLKTGLRYLPEFFPAEDYKMWVDCVKIARFYTIQERLVLYRMHSEQIGVTHRPEQIIIANQIKRELFSLLSPQLSEIDITYFINEFQKTPIKSIYQFKEQKAWIKKIIKLNQTNKNPFFNSKYLQKALNDHLKGKTLDFIIDHYFNIYNPLQLLRFYFSSPTLFIKIKIKYHIKLIIKSMLFYKAKR